MSTAAAPTSPQLRGGGITTVPSQHRAQDRHPVAVTPPSSQQRGPTHPNVMKGSHTVNTSTSRGAATAPATLPLAIANRTPHVNTKNKTPRADGGKHTGRRSKRRRPGAWPETTHSDALRRQLRRERARFEITLGAIRASFEEEPSPAAVRACARRWERALHQAADEVIAARHNRENAA